MVDPNDDTSVAPDTVAPLIIENLNGDDLYFDNGYIKDKDLNILGYIPIAIVNNPKQLNRVNAVISLHEFKTINNLYAKTESSGQYDDIGVRCEYLLKQLPVGKFKKIAHKYPSKSNPGKTITLYTYEIDWDINKLYKEKLKELEG